MIHLLWLDGDDGTSVEKFKSDDLLCYGICGSPLSLQTLKNGDIVTNERRYYRRQRDSTNSEVDEV